MKDFGVPPELLAELAEIKRQADACKAKISETALSNIGLKRGDLVCDEATGLHYRLGQASVFVSAGKVNISVYGRRVWKSGRKAGREAHSSSWLTFSSLKKVEQEPTNEPV